jgi:hypothetical protein
MALSSGNFELVRICWERLPGEQEAMRLDLVQVASDFHQLEILAWLFRDFDRFGKELFIDFAIRRDLADALLTVVVDGFKPWLAVATAATWAPAREIEFGPAPEGFWPDGGWWTNSRAEAKGIRPVQGRWTGELTKSEVGEASEVAWVVLPSGVSALGGDAFCNFATLASVTLPAGCLTIEDGTPFLPGAFARCGSLVTIAIPKGRMSIGSSAFLRCASLTGVAIPPGCVSIGECAFGGCESLAEVALPRGCASVGDFAFRQCASLAEAGISRGCTSIGRYAFYECRSLARVTIPTFCTSIGGSAFCGCLRLAEVTIPRGCTSIGGSAFWGCKSLANLIIAQGAASVGEFAFSGCVSLTEVRIGEGYTSVGRLAFHCCLSLTKVTIPRGCTLADDAFVGCPNVTVAVQ